MLGRWFGRAARGNGGDKPARPVWSCHHAAAPSTWRAAAALLDDGEPLPPPLHQALLAELAARAANVVDGWRLPAFAPLRVRRRDLPDWWARGGNLMLGGEGAQLGGMVPAIEGEPAGALLVLGAGASLREALVGGTTSIVAIGDDTHYPLVGIQANDGLVLLGEGGGATVFAQLDARNGGAILIGDDTIVGAGTRIITDDMHAIRDRATGRRINHRGGRIAIGRHVWIGEQVLIGGETAIGEDTVIGSGSFAKGAALPAHAVCVGRPARMVRTNTTWTREDAP